MGKIGSILFVCTGNMCRSPMAEGILKSVLQCEGRTGIVVSSAGTWGCEGEGAAPLAVEVCRERGIDISGHVARGLTEEMIRSSDLVLVMELDHLERVLDLVPEAAEKTEMLGRYGDKRRKGLGESIPDPFGRKKMSYERCFEQLDAYVTALNREL